jgi:hypothetical protein
MPDRHWLQQIREDALEGTRMRADASIILHGKLDSGSPLRDQEICDAQAVVSTCLR